MDIEQGPTGMGPPEALTAYAHGQFSNGWAVDGDCALVRPVGSALTVALVAAA